MATGITPLRGRPYPLETDVPDVAADMHTLALNLDQVPNITSGTTLPVSGMITGDEFLLTTTGQWYKYSGTAWNKVQVTTSGATIIAASETRTNTAFGTMPTPDQVTGIVLSTNGLLAIWYQATWQESVANAAQAEIWLDATPVAVHSNNGNISFGAAFVESAAGGTGHNTPLSTYSLGLISPQAQSTDSAADVTTGQIIGNYDSVTSTAIRGGGPCYVFAAAGTHTVSVQFKASSGSVTVSNRRLYVQATAF